MNIYLNRMTGIDDAIVSMYMSRRTWSRELELQIYDICGRAQRGCALTEGERALYDKWISKLVKWGWSHTTLLRFVDFTITVDGLHRGGQDDWDSHAKRFNNRIIRASTRLASFDYELSDWYKDKIIPTDVALTLLGIEAPDKIEVCGEQYVKSVNGYVREDLKDSNDAKRGLYMLSIPSTFIFKVDLTEFAHVYKERNANGSANPEVKECCECIADLIEAEVPQFNRELLMKIKN